MQRIARDFPNVASAVLYVREAHPGATIPAHKDMEEKRGCASLLKSESADIREVLVDGVEGSAHLAYGSMPNAVYIIDRDAIVRFKAPWNYAAATCEALQAVLAGKPANFRSYFKPAKPHIVRSTVRRAGAGSGVDLIKGMPRLVWNVLIKNNLRTLF